MTKETEKNEMLNYADNQQSLEVWGIRNLGSFHTLFCL